MGWITPEEMMPPEGLEVLLEVSGWYTGEYGCVADHSFYLGSWIVPSGETEGHWLIWDGCNNDSGADEGHIYDPKVHAWMPMPKHYGAREMGFAQEPDLMEHSTFEDDPEWLYKGEAVYEQMTLDEFLGMRKEKP